MAELLQPKLVSTLLPGDILVVPLMPEINHVTILARPSWPYFKLSLPFFGPYPGEDTSGPYEWRDGAGFVSEFSGPHPLITPGTRILRGAGLAAVKWYNGLPKVAGEVPRTAEILHMAATNEFAAKAQALVSLALQTKGDTHLIRLRQAIEMALQAPEADRVSILISIAANYGLRT